MTFHLCCPQNRTGRRNKGADEEYTQSEGVEISPIQESQDGQITIQNHQNYRPWSLWRGKAARGKVFKILIWIKIRALIKVFPHLIVDNQVTLVRKHDPQQQQLYAMKTLKKVEVLKRNQVTSSRLYSSKLTFALSTKKSKLWQTTSQFFLPLGDWTVYFVKLCLIFFCHKMAHVKAERDILAEADNEWVVKLYYSFQVSFIPTRTF